MKKLVSVSEEIAKEIARQFFGFDAPCVQTKINSKVPWWEFDVGKIKLVVPSFYDEKKEEYPYAEILILDNTVNTNAFADCNIADYSTCGIIHYVNGKIYVTSCSLRLQYAGQQMTSQIYTDLIYDFEPCYLQFKRGKRGIGRMTKAERAMVLYLIYEGGADCCKKCIHLNKPSCCRYVSPTDYSAECSDDYCIEGMVKYFETTEEDLEELEKFLKTCGFHFITPGHGFTKDDYEKVDQLLLHLIDVPINKLAEILSCEPEVVEKQLDALNHILHCIDDTWDKEEEQFGEFNEAEEKCGEL